MVAIGALHSCAVAGERSEKFLLAVICYMGHIHIWLIFRQLLNWIFILWSLQVSESNEVPISSHIYGSPRRYSDSSKTFKKLYDHYEWAKRMKFLLAVIYGSHRQYSNSSKTIKKLYDHYEWAKRMKFLLAVIYRSHRQYSNSSRISKKKSEKN